MLNVVRDFQNQQSHIVHKMVYLFLLILTAFNGICVSTSTPTKGFQVYILKNDCPGEYLPIKMGNVSIKLEKDLYFLQFSMSVDEDSSEDLKMEVLSTRCKAKGAPNTCEEYHKYTFPHLCKLLNIPGLPWSNYMDMMEPPYQCPPKKGVYMFKADNQKDFKVMERLNLKSGNFFKIILKTYGMESKKIYSCIKAEGQT